jgi:ribosomal protein L7/L12
MTESIMQAIYVEFTNIVGRAPGVEMTYEPGGTLESPWVLLHKQGGYTWSFSPQMSADCWSVDLTGPNGRVWYQADLVARVSEADAAKTADALVESMTEYDAHAQCLKDIRSLTDVALPEAVLDVLRRSRSVLREDEHADEHHELLEELTALLQDR